MKKEIRKNFRLMGTVSTAYIQRKYKYSFKESCRLLEEVVTRGDKKFYSECGFLMRLEK